MTDEPPRSEPNYTARQRAADMAYCRRVLNRLIEVGQNQALNLERQAKARPDTAASKLSPAPGAERSVLDIAADFARAADDACDAIQLARGLDTAEKVGESGADTKDRIGQRDRFIRELTLRLRERSSDTAPRRGGDGGAAILPLAADRPAQSTAVGGPLPGEGSATILPFPTQYRAK